MGRGRIMQAKKWRKKYRRDFLVGLTQQGDMNLDEFWYGQNFLISNQWAKWPLTIAIHRRKKNVKAM